jgi:phosphoenolpyruvate carboxykinase (GTP)
LFGGRRASAVPLVTEATSWAHGVFMASNVASEGTAAAENKVGELRRDPFAMLPFCGYNMGDYIRHWLTMGKRLEETPRIFHVNWFRKDADGKFIWPGFGENMRILEWIVNRVRSGGPAKETPIGWVPRYDDIRWEGLDFPIERWQQVMEIDRQAWRHQTLQHQELFLSLGEYLPKELIFERELLISRC